MVQAIYGAVLGDIVGSVYEWDNIKKKEFPFLPENSCFTDDSVATLAIADALANAVTDGSFDTNTDEDWRRVFTDSLRSFGRNHPFAGWGNRFDGWLWKDDYKPYGSCGNGSAMRVSAVAWFARSIEECERLARLSAEVSHDHADGIAGALATAGAAYLALRGGSKADIKAYVDRFYREEEKKYVRKKGLAAFTLDEIRPGYSFDHYAGLCRGTVPFAVEAFLESESCEDCIRATVSIGGDTDTLCAISGAIAEAYYGTPRAFIPAVQQKLTPDLLAVLEKLDAIEWPHEQDRGALSVRDAAAFLQAHDDYLILTHTRPDGDTLGCAAALCRMLRALGKTAAVLPNPETSAGYAGYLEGLWAQADETHGTVVSVDIAAESMFPENAKPYLNDVALAFDHHINGGLFAKQRCVQPGRAACGEILCALAERLGCLTPDAALPLYVAVATDTGCFVHSNTTEESHRVAARLIAEGIDFAAVNKRHFLTKSKRRVAMEAELMRSPEYFDGGRGVFVTISQEMIRRLELDEDDLDNVSRLGAQVEGIDCSVTLREQPSGDWKASVRTGARVNAAELCARFGGGGHAEAAGCILYGMTLDEARRAIREAVESLPQE